VSGKLLIALLAGLAVALVLTLPPPNVPIRRDIIYGRAGPVDLKLDLARPPKGEGPFPLVVCLHGGAWELGHRSAHHDTLRLLARHGYAAATVEYRLAPRYRFPAQLDDARRALRYLREHARELKIDPDRIAVLGDSAGGHLALLLGLEDPEDGRKVRAVVNYYGPTDLRTWSASPAGEQALKAATGGKDSAGLLADLLGTSDRTAPAVARASPVTHVNAGDPPVLTFHGMLDPLVPVEQAWTLHAALRKAGIPEKLVLLEDVGHGWSGEARERTDRLLLEFLDKYLKDGPARPHP
jgi:acetyl esterase/lipase